MGYNLSRAVGPAIAGYAIAGLSIAAPFWCCCAGNLALLAALIWWRAPRRPTDTLPAERLISAMMTGVRYVRYSREMDATLIRSIFEPRYETVSSAPTNAGISRGLAEPSASKSGIDVEVLEDVGAAGFARDGAIAVLHHAGAARGEDEHGGGGDVKELESIAAGAADIDHWPGKVRIVEAG